MCSSSGRYTPTLAAYWLAVIEKVQTLSPGVPTKIIGACFGLTAFAIATIAGLLAGNAAEVVIGRALVSMVICQVVGWVIGFIGERTVTDAIREYQSARPVDGSEAGSAAQNVGPGSSHPAGRTIVA